MERIQIRLDEQGKQDAELIDHHYSLGSRSAAIRFALREVARNVARSVASQEPKDNPPQQNAE